MNISHFHSIFFDLKICGEIVTPFKVCSLNATIGCKSNGSKLFSRGTLERKTLQGTPYFLDVMPGKTGKYNVKVIF